jgi:acyl-CoA reductase-like NAD-dependent aldehyde dehydrogenase
MNIESSGSYWDKPSLVWGLAAGQGELQTNVSPLGHELQTVRQLSENEVDHLFQPGDFQAANLPALCDALNQLFQSRRQELLADLRGTTGFNAQDCEETLEGCISLLERFQVEEERPLQAFEHGGRRISLKSVPWGTVAAVLPQNAFLIMGLIALLNGLAAGNRVILRAPTGSARMGAVLGQLLLQAGFDPRSFSLVMCDAAQFVAAWERSVHPVLLHYMGSSGRGGELLAKSFEAGQPCLIDGEGNTYLYVDEDQDPVVAAELAWKGAIRYNGQTCTSVNGVVVHPVIDARFRTKLRELVTATTFGLAQDDEVGPLFSARQAQAAEELIQASKGRTGRRGLPRENLFPPTIVEDPATDSDLVRKGLFAPAVWIRTGDFQEFCELWKANRYPLCAGISSYESRVAELSLRLPGLSRIVWNGDPSLEDAMEPWGGYPPCGSNPVSTWFEKYRRTMQVDQTE